MKTNKKDEIDYFWTMCVTLPTRDRTDFSEMGGVFEGPPAVKRSEIYPALREMARETLQEKLGRPIAKDDFVVISQSFERDEV